MPAQSSPPVRPRIILELAPDGTLIAENYINGQRTRQALLRGWELDDIRTILTMQNWAMAEEVKRKAAAAEAADIARHRRVWQTSAATRGQGIDFANRVIGPLPKAASAASPKTASAPLATTAAVLVSLI